MLVYQLIADGENKYGGWHGHIHSRNLFPSPKAAKEYEPEFRQIVTTDIHDHDFSVLSDDNNLTIRIIELEVM